MIQRFAAHPPISKPTLQQVNSPSHGYGVCRPANLGRTASASFGPAAHPLAAGSSTRTRVVPPWGPRAPVAQHSTGTLAEHITPAVAALCQAFQVENLQALQDVLNCLVLSEVVYKVVDLGEEAAAASVTQLRQDFPPGLVSVQHLQWSLPHVGHRYLVAEGGDALYVAFMGTKARRDLLTNANVVLEPLWPDEQPSAEGPVPSAHRGFLQRARGVPLASLAEHARRQGKRLVFCGHSLGGAVATLCTLDLLHGLPRHASLPVSCVAFAGPAVGNAALAKLVRRRGWERHLSNFMLPEDRITRWFSSVSPTPTSPSVPDRSPKPPKATPEQPGVPQQTDGQPSGRAVSPAGPPAAPHWPQLRFAWQRARASAPLGGAFAADEAAPSGMLAISPLHAAAADSGGRMFGANRTARDGEGSPRVGLLSGSTPRRQHSGSPTRRHAMGLRFRTNNVVPFAALPRHAAAGRLAPQHQHVFAEPERQAQHVAAASGMHQQPLPGCLAHEQQQPPGRTFHSQPVGGDCSDGQSGRAEAAGGRVQAAEQLPHSEAAALAGTLAALPADEMDVAGDTAALAAKQQPFSLTRAALKLVSIHKWSARIYQPLGRQFFLTPYSAVSSSDSLGLPSDEPGSSQPDSSAAASSSDVDAPPQGAAQQAQHRQRGQLLWMHRMPSYRARIKQILASAGLALSDQTLHAPHSQRHQHAASLQLADGSPAALSSSVAPRLRPKRAFTRIPLVCPTAATADQLCSLIQDGLLGQSRGAEDSGSWPPASSWLWPWLPIGRNSSASGGLVHVEVVVRGEGLDTCTSAKVRALGETWLPVELVSQPAPGAAAVGGHLRSPWRALREAAGGLVREGEHMGAPNELVLRVALPASLLCALHLGPPPGAALQPPLVVVLQSDFAVAEVPLQYQGHVSWPVRPLRGLQCAGQLLHQCFPVGSR